MSWLDLDKETIFSGKDGNGNRYLSQFLADYQKTFNPEHINAGCKRCLNDYYDKFIKHLIMSNTKSQSKNSGYLLKKKYEGIPMYFGSRTLVYNNTLTDEIAEEMLKKHPRGKDLFENIPEKSKKGGSEEEAPKAPEATATKSPLDELLELKRNELNAKAAELGIENPEEFKNKTEVAQAILEKSKKGGSEEEE